MLHGIKLPAPSPSPSPFSWRTAWRTESQLIAARDGVVVARVQQQPDGSGWRAYRIRRAAFDGEHVDEREVVVDERVSDGNLRLAMTGLYRDAVERERERWVRSTDGDIVHYACDNGTPEATS